MRRKGLANGANHESGCGTMPACQAATAWQLRFDRCCCGSARLLGRTAYPRGAITSRYRYTVGDTTPCERVSSTGARRASTRTQDHCKEATQVVWYGGNRARRAPSPWLPVDQGFKTPSPKSWDARHRPSHEQGYGRHWTRRHAANSAQDH